MLALPSTSPSWAISNIELLPRNIGHLTGTGWELEALFVPLAISFFTFQQIAFLVDVKDGRGSRRQSHRIRGLCRVVSPADRRADRPLPRNRTAVHRNRSYRCKPAKQVREGSVCFCHRPVQKDRACRFNRALCRHCVCKGPFTNILGSWAGAGAYSLQLYFDFSGYSDMAVGLGLMLGLTLPFNFDVPFRSTSMIVFWKRWHITMTRFFMMYLYSPIALAVMRWSAARELSGLPAFSATIAMPIIVTFLLSGLWHGAAWTFVAFGGVNAIGLTVNHAWREAKLPRPPAFIGWLLTMLTVVISFVYFRAASLADAHAVLTAMFSPHHLILPNWLSGLATAFDVPWRTLELFASGTYTVRLAIWILLLSCLALIRRNPAARQDDIKPTWPTALLTAGALLISIALLDRPQAFIYFQF